MLIMMLPLIRKNRMKAMTTIMNRAFHVAIHVAILVVITIGILVPDLALVMDTHTQAGIFHLDMATHIITDLITHTGIVHIITTGMDTIMATIILTIMIIIIRLIIQHHIMSTMDIGILFLLTAIVEQEAVQ